MKKEKKSPDQISISGKEFAELEKRVASLQKANKKLREKLAEIHENEHTLHESEERYRLITELASDYVFKVTISDEGRPSLEYVSENYSAITGRPREDIKDIGSWISIIHENDINNLMDLMQRIIRHGVSAAMDCRSYHKNGSLRWTHIFARPIIDEKSGKVTSIIGAVKDISDRKIYEHELLKSKAFLERAQMIARIGYWEFDFNAGTAWISPIARDIFGLSKEKLTIDEVKNIPLPRYRQALEIEIKNLREGTAPYDVEFRIKRKNDGQERDIHSMAEYHREDNKVFGVIYDITDRKKAEETMRESETRYRTLFENTPTGILVADVETKEILHSNPSMCRLLGYREDELKKMKILEIHPDDSHPRIISEFEALARGEKSSSTDIPCLRKDGTICFVEIYASMAVIEGRKSNIGFFNDITDRRQAETELWESRVRLESALESGKADSWELNLATGGLTYSQRWATMLGYGPGEIDPTFKAVNELIHPEDLPRVEKTMNDYLRGKIESYDTELRLKVKDGRWIWIISRGKIVERNNKGNPTRVLGTSFDITDLKNSEKALQEKTEELDRFFNLALDLLCVADTDGYFRRLNPQWEKALGYRLEDMEGKKFLDLVHPEDMNNTNRAVSELAAKKEVINFINRYRHRDGTYRWIEWRAVPYGDRLIYAAARDITERMENELSLQRSEERYRELFNKMSSGVAVYEAINNGEDFIFKDFNSSGERMDNIRREELIGKSVLTARPGVVEMGLIDVFRTVYRTGVPLHYPVAQYQDNTLSGWYENFVYKLPSGEIVAVYDNITDRVLAQQMIQDSLIEKETLLREVHHRVKNNLGIIYSLLYFQREKNSDPYIDLFLKNLQNRILSMTLIHQKLYKTEDLSSIDFADYSRELSKEILNSYSDMKDTVVLTLNIQNIHLDIDTVMPCGLILNELISNSLKYAFPDSKKGEIVIDFHYTTDYNCLLSVSDNGVGLPADFDPDRQQSMGMFIIFSLAKQLKAETTISKGKGLTVSLAFQLNPERVKKQYDT